MTVRAFICLLFAAALLGCAGTDSPVMPCTSQDPLTCGTQGFCQKTTNICVSCPRYKWNCDLNATDCESKFPCKSTGTPCDVNGLNSCGTASQYCELDFTGSGTCRVCPSSTYNCNAQNNDRCESRVPCTTMSNCVDAQKNSCGSQSLFCLSGRCKSCTGGWYNCNGENADQCEEREVCSVGVACVEDEPNSCGHIANVCVGTSCTACNPPGTFNCNGLNNDGCESTNCNTATNCVVDNPDSCGDEQRFCQAGICQTCPSGKNCNGLNGDGCEADSCNECEVNIWNSCGSEDRYCVNGTCVACTGVEKNCNREDSDGCEEKSGSCGSTQECKGPDHYKAADGSCLQCDTGTFNCADTVAGCECKTKCDAVYGCLLDCADTQYRSPTNQCLPCPDSAFLNCDGDSECECDTNWYGYCQGKVCLYQT